MGAYLGSYELARLARGTGMHLFAAPKHAPTKNAAPTHTRLTDHTGEVCQRAIMATPTPRCFNLEVGNSTPAPPKCETTRFLCTACQETCGFCDKSKLPSCEDNLPERECKIFLTAFATNSSVYTPATGYCDAALAPSRTPGTWWQVAGDHHHEGGLRYAASPRGDTVLGEAEEHSLIVNTLVRVSHSGPIVLIGDSNMRYQYLTLAHYLHTGVWPARPHRNAFSVCYENTVFNDRTLQTPQGQALSATFQQLAHLKPMDSQLVAWKWRTFFNQTNRALGGPQLEVCECDPKSSQQMENRLFEMLIPPAGTVSAAASSRDGTASGVDSARGASQPQHHRGHSIRLAFLGMQGNGAVSTVDDWGGGWEALRSSWRSSCDAGACTGRRLHVGNDDFLRKRLAPLRPSMVIFGPGPWMKTKGDRGVENVRRFLSGVKAVLGPRGRAIFRTCPRGSVRLPARRGCSNGASCDEPFRALVNETGWELLDLYTLTEDLWAYIGHCADRGGRSQQLPPCHAQGNAFTDNFHFQCSVYREMNRWMLRELFDGHHTPVHSQNGNARVD